MYSVPGTEPGTGCTTDNVCEVHPEMESLPRSLGRVSRVSQMAYKKESHLNYELSLLSGTVGVSIGQSLSVHLPEKRE